MLGFVESGKLMRILKGGKERTIEEIVADFDFNFSVSLRFYACSALDYLTSDHKEQILSPSQRLIAFAILHQAYASQQLSSNPFVSKLINMSARLLDLMPF